MAARPTVVGEAYYELTPGGSVNADKSIMINRDPARLDVLGERLRNIFKTRAERVMFVRGAPTLDFRDVAQVIDIGKGAGVDRIGLLTEELQDSL